MALFEQIQLWVVSKSKYVQRNDKFFCWLNYRLIFDDEIIHSVCINVDKICVGLRSFASMDTFRMNIINAFIPHTQAHIHINKIDTFWLIQAITSINLIVPTVKVSVFISIKYRLIFNSLGQFAFYLNLKFAVILYKFYF